MRRYFAGIAGFVAVDQAIKLVIWNFFFGQQFTLIPGLLRFHPIINEKLSWGGNYLSLLSNPVFINLLNIFLIAVYLSAF